MADVKQSRKEKAAVTRRRMLDAAHGCFAASGYPGTTMAEIAQAADVAVQTLYFTFHSKAELLGQVFERAVLGEAGSPPQMQDWYREAEATEDLSEALHRWATGVGTIAARVAPLRPVFDGVGPDDDVAALWSRGEQLRADGFGSFLGHLVERHGLAPGVDQAELVDVAMVIIGPLGHRGFVEDCGWSLEAWIDFSVVALRRWFR